MQCAHLLGCRSAAQQEIDEQAAKDLERLRLIREKR